MSISFAAKASIFVGSAVATGVAGYLGVTKTETGAKAWASAQENYKIQKERIYTVYTDCYAASKQKFNDLKQKLARSEAKAV
jgi:hypothetical protein